MTCGNFCGESGQIPVASTPQRDPAQTRTVFRSLSRIACFIFRWTSARFVAMSNAAPSNPSSIPSRSSMGIDGNSTPGGIPVMTVTKQWSRNIHLCPNSLFDGTAATDRMQYQVESVVIELAVRNNRISVDSPHLFTRLAVRSGGKTYRLTLDSKLKIGFSFGIFLK
jgi:hypothetical protein